MVAAQKHQAAIQQLGVTHLFACVLLLIFVIAASHALRLDLAGRIVISASRCAVQLLILCAFVLEPLFGRNDPKLIVAYLSLIVALAAKEASSRLKYGYAGLRLHFAAAFACGAGSVILYAAVFVLALSPPWDAKYVVPVSGMVVGNVLTATALGCGAFLTDVAERADVVELALARGATWREAALPSLRSATTAALTPTLNSMAVMGLVMMPGMMTGQMLGGQPPVVAGCYQVMIMYLVCAASCLTTLVLLGLASTAAFDTARHALRRGALAPRPPAQRRDILVSFLLFLRDAASRSVALLRASFAGRAYAPIADDVVAKEEPKPRAYAVSVVRGTASTGEVLLQAQDVVVALTNLTCSLELRRGGRTALTGETGAGKTQLLKTLAKLVPAAGGRLAGFDGPPPAYRSRVAFVSQDRPTVAGSPRDHLDQVLAFGAQRHRDPVQVRSSIESYAESWRLPTEKLGAPWASLSGGEAQRANLAIALALAPDVLLLDEPTSACDAATTALVEASLLAFPGALVVVTHSQEQAARLGAVHLHLSAVDGGEA